jgi:ring-1,2-phenylacetyl-CoA epoxidase subunit PaaE
MHAFQPLRICEVMRQTPEAIIITLQRPAAMRAHFKPGQHLAVRAVIDGAEQRRTYSICSGPDEANLRLAIKRVAGGVFSNWANESLAPGGTLEAMPPAGRFILPESDGSARHVLAFAAGTGITPIMAMVKHALANEPETFFTLVYGNRTPQSILFREELEDLKDRYLGRFSLLHVLSCNEESSAPLLEGRITADKVKLLAPRLAKLDGVAHVFLCGPGSLIKDARRALLELGLPREKVHFEFFAPGGGSLRAAPAPKPAPQNTPHQEGCGTEVVALIDGVRHPFIVPPGQHVVDAALAAGIRVPYACKGGMCCTCRAKVVEGQAAMTLNYSLEPWEIARGFILTCQTVPSSKRLVLDYDQL